MSDLLPGFVIDTPANIERGRQLAERGITDSPKMLDRIAIAAWQQHCRKLDELAAQQKEQKSSVQTINKEIENA